MDVGRVGCIEREWEEYKEMRVGWMYGEWEGYRESGRDVGKVGGCKESEKGLK